MAIPDNETRARILDVAERLFSERGYAAVRLRDIGDAVGMKHASLYYYAPGGKEQLYIEVMERGFQRHRDGLTAAIAGAGDDLRAQMHAVAAWLATQPPIDLGRMVHADTRDIARTRPDVAERLTNAAYYALRDPIAAMLEAAMRRGEVEFMYVDMAAIALATLVSSVHAYPGDFPAEGRVRLAQKLADMLLYGWLKR
jgi:AcrR family transcriptional regulator